MAGRALERMLNRPLVGWVNAVLYDARLGVAAASTALAYQLKLNDPDECLAAGAVVGLTAIVTNLLLYARLDRELETKQLEHVLPYHQLRHTRIWAEANGQLDRYRDILERD